MFLLIVTIWVAMIWINVFGGWYVALIGCVAVSLLRAVVVERIRQGVQTCSVVVSIHRLIVVSWSCGDHQPHFVNWCLASARLVLIILSFKCETCSAGMSTTIQL